MMDGWMAYLINITVIDLQMEAHQKAISSAQKEALIPPLPPSTSLPLFFQ